jgi:hypothetical protein
MQAARGYLGLMQQACVLIRQLQIKPPSLPVLAQQSFELRVLLGRDFAIELGVDQSEKRFVFHANPS